MVAVTVAERMTAAQFLGQPDRPGAEWLQLVEGEVVVTDPNARHNFAQGDLVFAFETWSRSKGGRGRAMLPLDVALELDRPRTLHSPLLPGFALNLGELFPAR